MRAIAFGSRARLVLATMLVATLPVVVVPDDAPATTTARKRIPIKHVADVLVDKRNERVFLTGGIGTRKVVALDLRGRVVKVFKRMRDPVAMIRHRNRLFVLLARPKALQVINMKHLRRGPRYKVGPASNPLEMVKSGGRLWFWTGLCNDHLLRSFDLRTQRKRTYELRDLGCSQLAAHHKYGGRIFAVDNRSAPAFGYKIDVRGVKPVVRKVREPLGEATIKGGVVMHPNGRSLLAAANGEIERFRVSDMAKEARYPSERYPWGLKAMKTRRSHVMAATFNSLVDVQAWRITRNRPLGSYSFSGRYNLPYPRGLAIHPSGRRLWVFTGLLQDRTYLHRVRL